MEESFPSLASSAIDISDGIIQDLSHLFQDQELAVDLDLDKVPLAASNMQSNAWSLEMIISSVYSASKKIIITAS